jgi:hypothetical protein
MPGAAGPIGLRASKAPQGIYRALPILPALLDAFGIQEPYGRRELLPAMVTDDRWRAMTKNGADQDDAGGDGGLP